MVERTVEADDNWKSNPATEESLPEPGSKISTERSLPEYVEPGLNVSTEHEMPPPLLISEDDDDHDVAASECTFKDLLVQLHNLHQREIRKYTKENAALQRRLCGQSGEDSKRRPSVSSKLTNSSGESAQTLGLEERLKKGQAHGAPSDGCRTPPTPISPKESAPPTPSQMGGSRPRGSLIAVHHKDLGARRQSLSAGVVEDKPQNHRILSSESKFSMDSEYRDPKSSKSAVSVQSAPQFKSHEGVNIYEEYEESRKTFALSYMSGVSVKLLFVFWAKYTKAMRKTFEFKELRTFIEPIARSGSRISTHRLSVSSSESLDPGRLKSARRRCNLVINPTSSHRMWWDLFGGVLLGFDIIMIPMSAFMSPEESLFFKATDYTTLCFWSFDMVASCITGYIDPHTGATVMSVKSILKSYFKTWFLLDVLICGPDWACTSYELIEGSELGAGGNSSKLLRALRIVRMTRMLRLVKLKRTISMIRDRIDSEYIFIMMDIFKLILVLLIINHFLAACWYAIGDYGKESGAINWVQTYLGQNPDDQPISNRYFLAYHWSLTQFSPAAMEVFPCNVAERIYAIFVLLIGMVLFSSFISSITASTTQLRQMEGSTYKQLWLLRRYLNQNGVTTKTQLFWRILRYIEYACSVHKYKIFESQVHVLKYLSVQLQNELNYTASFSQVKFHPFFEFASERSRMIMVRLAEVAMDIQALAAEEIVLGAGARTDCMVMIVYGEIGYFDFEGDLEDRVTGGDWACEACLWTGWHSLGQLETATESKIVLLHAREFGKVIRKDYPVWRIAAAYAKKFCEHFSNLPRKQLTDIFKAKEMLPIVTSFVPQLDPTAMEGISEAIDSMNPATFPGSKRRLSKGYEFLANAAKGTVSQAHRMSVGRLSRVQPSGLPTADEANFTGVATNGSQTSFKRAGSNESFASQRAKNKQPR